LKKTDPFGGNPPDESFMTGATSDQADQVGGADEPVQADHVGALLCATRMRLGGDLQEIAKILRIRYGYLVAIEDGRFEDLPGAAYSIGFVRAYSDFLGLDGNEVVRRLREESAGSVTTTRFEFSAPRGESGLPHDGLLAVAVGLGMFVYAAWYSMSNADRDAIDLIQEVPARLAVLLDKDNAGERPLTQTAQTRSQDSGDPLNLDVEEQVISNSIDESFVQDESAVQQTTELETYASGSAAEGRSIGIAEGVSEEVIAIEDTRGQSGYDSVASSEVVLIDKPEASSNQSSDQARPDEELEYDSGASSPLEDTQNVIASAETFTMAEDTFGIDDTEQVEAEETKAAIDELGEQTSVKLPKVTKPAPKPLAAESEVVALLDIDMDGAEEASRAVAEESASNDASPDYDTSNTSEAQAPPSDDQPADTDKVTQNTLVDINAPSETATIANPASNETQTIELRAKSDSWIQVRDGEGLLLTRLLRQGEVYRVPNRDGLTLMTGNAGGLEVFVGGELMPPLGDEGVVRRGVPLSAERLSSSTRPG